MIIAANSTLTGNTREAKAVADITMVIVLVIFSMLFATLFLGYAALRFTSPVWPPMGMTDLPTQIPLLSTAFIALSSLTWVLFEKSFKTIWAVSTMILGLVFTATQFALWSELQAQGIFASTGVFASIIYAFTWIHLAHIGLALIALIWPIAWAVKGTAANLHIVKIQSIGKFWHFLGIVWFLMFVSLFLT